MTGTTALAPAELGTAPRAAVRSTARRTAELVVFVVAGLIVWAVLYVTVLSTFPYGHTQAWLYSSFRTQLASGTAPLAEPTAHGAPVALLDSPAMGWNHLVVVEGTTPTDLERGPGHAIGTVLPGQVGTSVLMGRALSFGGPFGSLDTAVAGTRVTVTTGQGTFVYVLHAFRSAGALFKAPAPGAGRLTLITLHGATAITPGSMVFVDLDLVGRAASAGAVATPDPDGAPLARDIGVANIAELILSLQLVLIVAVAFVWGSRRWSRVGAWACGVPALLMALTVASSFAARLLPNLV